MKWIQNKILFLAHCLIISITVQSTIFCALGKQTAQKVCTFAAKNRLIMPLSPQRFHSSLHRISRLQEKFPLPSSSIPIRRFSKISSDQKQFSAKSSLAAKERKKNYFPPAYEIVNKKIPKLPRSDKSYEPTVYWLDAQLRYRPSKEQQKALRTQLKIIEKFYHNPTFQEYRSIYTQYNPETAPAELQANYTRYLSVIDTLWDRNNDPEALKELQQHIETYVFNLLKTGLPKEITSLSESTPLHNLIFNWLKNKTKTDSSYLTDIRQFAQRPTFRQYKEFLAKYDPYAIAQTAPHLVYDYSALTNIIELIWNNQDAEAFHETWQEDKDRIFGVQIAHVAYFLRTMTPKSYHALKKEYNPEDVHDHLPHIKREFTIFSQLLDELWHSHNTPSSDNTTTNNKEKTEEEKLAEINSKYMQAIQDITKRK